jgi:hypothetical protein
MNKSSELTKTYHEMLENFGDTLQKTSEDSDGSGESMTQNQSNVVNFDKFKKSIAEKLGLKDHPKSCDALYMDNKHQWLLIEFKNGKTKNIANNEIHGKIFESLLLLTEKFEKTITFTRSNMTFVFVYNDISEKDKIAKKVHNFAKEDYIPFGLAKFEKLYFKKVLVCGKTEFDEKIVAKLFPIRS